MHIRHWRESQKERDHYEDQHLGGRIILKCTLQEKNGVVRT
jgi:hypothetical protein